IDNDGNGYVDDVHGINVHKSNGDLHKADGVDHGTHVAGIVAAADNNKGNTGVAAGKALVMGVGGIYDADDSLVAFEKAVEYVVDQKVNHGVNVRSEEHTSELQSRENLVCRLLLEKKKKKKHNNKKELHR